LFDRAVYQQLEAALGPECYHDALEQGKGLKLDTVLSEIMTAINEPTAPI
jgi:hypothetical protein